MNTPEVRDIDRKRILSYVDGFLALNPAERHDWMTEDDWVACHKRADDLKFALSFAMLGWTGLHGQPVGAVRSDKSLAPDLEDQVEAHEQAKRLAALYLDCAKVRSGPPAAAIVCEEIRKYLIQPV